MFQKTTTIPDKKKSGKVSMLTSFYTVKKKSDQKKIDIDYCFVSIIITYKRKICT
jgi:2-methylaconitate cis-trans-isomerase PrpF